MCVRTRKITPCRPGGRQSGEGRGSPSGERVVKEFEIRTSRDLRSF